jgi:hypothetical protein
VFLIAGTGAKINFGDLTEVFPCFFLSCKGNTRVKFAFLDGARPTLFHILFFCYLCCSMYFFVLFYLLFVCNCVLPLGDNPIAVNIIIIVIKIIIIIIIIILPERLDRVA